MSTIRRRSPPRLLRLHERRTAIVRRPHLQQEEMKNGMEEENLEDGHLAHPDNGRVFTFPGILFILRNTSVQFVSLTYKLHFIFF